MMRIGYIYANIAGDSRYGSKIEVERTETGNFPVSRSETSPVGGMDSGLPHGGFRETGSVLVHEYADASKVVAAIKKLIDTEVGATIKKYGKPTKRFSWYGIEKKGLSLALVREALGHTQEEC